jgi:pyridoxal phosphate enzyme (YggS family)
MLDIRANLRAVQERVAAACARANRGSGDVLLIGVSKTVELERIRLAVEAGVPALGENRVQEAKEKIESLGRPVPWHLIGSLQTNKARDAARLFDWIQSVDRVELAHELDRRAHQAERALRVLVQVNIGEASTRPSSSGSWMRSPGSRISRSAVSCASRPPPTPPRPRGRGSGASASCAMRSASSTAPWA